MKFKLIPILGLTTIASALPLTVSCGNGWEKKYEKVMDLSNVIKGYQRQTKYCEVQPEIVLKAYMDATNSNHNVFYDDIFETIAASTYWSSGSTLKGKLGLNFDNIKNEPIENIAFWFLTITASSYLDNVVLKLHTPKSTYKITEMSFNGTIGVKSLPISINSSYVMMIRTKGLSDFKNWSISINGHASIKTKSNKVYEDDINKTFDYASYTESILEKFILADLLSYVRFPLPYFKDIK